MLRGHNSRWPLNNALQVLPSNVTAGVFSRRIFPGFSSTKRSTQVFARKTLPQNGTSSASN
jgi:hypothetical protein